MYVYLAIRIFESYIMFPIVSLCCLTHEFISWLDFFPSAGTLPPFTLITWRLKSCPAFSRGHSSLSLGFCPASKFAPFLLEAVTGMLATVGWFLEKIGGWMGLPRYLGTSWTGRCVEFWAYKVGVSILVINGGITVTPSNCLING